MLRQKAVLLIGAFLLLFPIAAFSTSDPLHLSLNFDRRGATWSWAGRVGSTLTFTPTGLTTIQDVEGATSVPLVDATATTSLTSNLAYSTTPTFAAGGSGNVAGGVSVQTLNLPSVPEPASLLIFGTGLFALGFFLRRRRAP